MTYTRIRCERSEQQSHAKRVIESGHHQIQKLLLDSKNYQDPARIHKAIIDHQIQKLLLDSKNYQDPTRIHKAIIDYQFQQVFQPHWFGSIQWQPFITDYATAVKEARHFRNKFFCALLKTKPTKIPNPPGRPRIIWFHEKAPVCINPQELQNPRFKIAFHTHFHLEECPEPYDSWIHLDWLIRNQVAKGFHRFSTSNSKENKGFVLKPWIHEHHANYNLKDYYRFRHHQDSDLVLDIENSDLQFTRN